MGGIRYDGGAGGASPLTIFTDSLIGADQPFVAGDNWLPVFNVIDNSTTGPILSGGVNRGVTGLTFTNNTGAGFLPLGFCIPYNYDLGSVKLAAQFVQFKMVSNPAGIGRIAGVCYCNLNLGTWYQMLTITEASQLVLNRIAPGGGVTTLIAPSAATAYVNGDILKLTADAVSTPGTTILKLFRNGVQIGATVNDNAVGRLTSGVVGLEMAGANPAVAITISNYNGGKA